LIPASIIGYGSHLVDMMRWLGGDFASVASTMKNFVPERVVRGLEGRQRFQVEDGCVALVEFAGGAHGMLQSSYIAVGAYPGIEIRVYGSKGAAVARLVTEFGVAETLHFATPDQVEFRKIELPEADLPPGATLNTPWPELYYRNLIRFFVDEILEDRSIPSSRRISSGAGWTWAPRDRGRRPRRHLFRAPLRLSAGGRHLHGDQRLRRGVAGCFGGRGRGGTGGVGQAHRSAGRNPRA
jgi:predicted dehydrogenase